MKKATTILAVVLLTANLYAQAPQKMSYQAVIRDNSSTLISSQQVGMQISILEGSSSGMPVYVETQSPTTNVNGLVSLEVGGGTVVSGAFSSVNWSGNNYYIKTETDPTGGTNYTISGTSQLLSVPYALYAASGTPGPQGIQGTPGPQGNDGPQGSANINGSNNYLVKFSGSTDGINSLLWDDGTHIGLGNTTPSEKLDVTGNIRSGSNIIVDGDQTNAGDITGNSCLRFGQITSGEGIGSKRTSGGNQYGLDFYTASANRLAINVNGNVGVGTTTPNSTLEINGTVSAKRGSATSSAIFAGNGVSLPDAYFIEVDGSVPNARFKLPTAGTCPGRMYILYTTFTNDVIIESNGGSSFFDFQGAATTEVSLPLSNRMIHVISDGTNWIWGRYQ